MGTPVIPFRPVRAIAAGLALFIGAAVWAAEPGAKEEEVDLDALEGSEPKPVVVKSVVPMRVPEHEYDRKLIVFPVLLILILAWNVKWKRTAG